MEEMRLQICQETEDAGAGTAQTRLPALPYPKGTWRLSVTLTSPAPWALNPHTAQTVLLPLISLPTPVTAVSLAQCRHLKVLRCREVFVISFFFA